MRPTAFILAAAATLQQATASGAAEFIIGVAAPLTGPMAPLGEQVRAGAEAAAAALSSESVVLETGDTACTAEGGEAAARQLADAAVVIGFLCTEAIEAALPILTEAGVPVITVGVRTDSLTDRRQKTGWQVFRLAPRADAELAAVSSILIPRWREELFAVIDDGTIYGRDLAEGFRLAAEEAGLKPVFTDTFRPQLDNQIALAGRLRKAGATHVLAGGDRDDLAILGRDAAELGMDLTIAGGEALRAAPGAVDLQPGTLMVGLPEWFEIGSEGVVASLRDTGTEPEGYVLPAYAAVEIAAAALAQASSRERDVTDILSGGRFQTVLGPVSFDTKGDWTAKLYRLFRYSGEAFEEME